MNVNYEGIVAMLIGIALGLGLFAAARSSFYWVRRRLRSRAAGKALGIDAMELEKNTMEMSVQHPLFAALIEAAAELFASTPAQNFLSMRGYHPKIGPLEIIVQKKLGKTPADLVQELKAEVTRLRQAELDAVLGMQIIQIGDYVLATKWSDGDSGEPWAIGFVHSILIDRNSLRRYQIVDQSGKSIIYGYPKFRRAEKISPEIGTWLLAQPKHPGTSLYSLLQEKQGEGK